MTGILPAISDRVALERTRAAWHGVAEHVLAPARFAVDGHIGLVATPGGFGVPADRFGRVARVDGRDLVVSDGGRERVEQLTTLAGAAAALGIEPGAPPVYTPSTTLAPDAPLEIDTTAARTLAAWFDLAWSALTDLGDDVTIWPEHFDAAISLGDEAPGQRGTFGASPGDGEHPEPYLYVTHWSDVPDDPYWNDAAFGGASLGYDAVAGADEPARAVRDFYAAGRALLMRA